METIFMEPKYSVLFMEEVREFLNGLDPKSRQKIIYNIDKARILNDKELFKKLQGEIWEFRTLYNKTYYRLFAFWDKYEQQDTLVLATHGIMTKSNKTPPKEIEKAEKIRTLYLDNKN